MFQKPAFSNNTSGFGSFNTATTTSPFGGFKPTGGASAFGAPPAFGAAAAPQPAAGGGLFGTTNTSGGLFGGTTASPSAPAFGASTSGFGFGASTSTAGGLFGNTATTGLFGNTQNASSFGAKPAGFGFGGAATTSTTGGGLFGTTPTTGTGLFGQQNNQMSGGGLFANNTGAFGQQPTAPGTAHVKYNPVVGTDVVVKSGTSQNINIKHHCITCMKEYENKSLEELRLEDYTAGRKGNTSGVFGGFQQPTENKPLFGGTTSFAQPATTSAPSVFGGGGLGTAGGFGQTNTFSFGGAAQNATNTTGMFGANKPAFGATPATGTGLFGAPTTQAAPSFGTTTSSFGFGAAAQNQQSSNVFGAKPATSGFGAAAPTTGFGSFGTQGPLFGSKPQQTTAPAFGTTTNAFGTLAGGFGTNTSSAGGIFGANNTFGKTITAQPAFGFNTQTTGLGGGATLGGGAAFQSKPAAPPFGQLVMFPQPQAQNTFRTGLDSGLGGGIFSNTATLGGASLGMGALGANNSALNNSSMLGASAAGNVHEQMLTLAARPYGDSPLFKDLLPDNSTTDDVLKPTNPACMKAVLERAGGNSYRVSSPPSRLKLQPRLAALTRDKKSLFDGLEESDASLEDKLSLKPSRKRLSLRPNQRDHNGSTDQPDSTTRSVDEPPQNTLPSHDKENSVERANNSNSEDMERARRQVNFAQRNNLEVSSERNGSWLSSSKLPWGDKEKPMDGEPTPRLYPSLDKELPEQSSERRASWLTTKPLRKPLATNPDSAESSVRELGVRDRLADTQDKENLDTLSDTPERLQFCRHRWGEQAGCCTCEKIQHQIQGLYVSEEENVLPCEAPPHPTGVKLTRPGYYAIPSLDEMTGYMRPDGSCVVPHLTIGRRNYGNVYYDCEIDVAGLDLDSLVHFMNKEVIVYPEDAEKPAVGTALNRRAIVTLDRIWPRDKTEKRPITDPDRLMKMDYEGKLRRVCDKHDTKFIEYRPQTGSWVFRVEHFSKYGLTDSDEEDDPTPDVLKRQLANQSLQKSAAPALKPQAALVTSAGLGGLGYNSMVPAEDNLFAMHQTSLNLLNGAAKAFEMDTTEDNEEAQSLYQDNRAYGVKSPTTELARLEHRQSHNVQLMKASLYADTEMEDDISVSTGDQLVPLSTTLLAPRDLEPLEEHHHQHHAMDVAPSFDTEEQVMQPLIIHPHTMVLKYHRKVPPFKQTIAGRLDAACIADMSVCRARHSRVGFGPAGTLVYATTYDSVSEMPKTADLCELGRYVQGRSQDDWSEPVVARLAISHNDTVHNMQDILARHLETLLEWSTSSPCADTQCPQLKMKDGAADQLAVLQRHLKHAAVARHQKATFGVSGSYCYEVWKLCEALWGADLENDGIPGTDELSIVNRHKKFLEWLTSAVADITDEELAKSREAELEDESDGHSAQVWTLMLGGRVLDACRLARSHGDLNMAVLIAQGAGDAKFQSLISRQLSTWRECGADSLVSARRLAALQLCAGRARRDLLARTDWLRALHATARYLCPQVPSLETILRKYESFFATSDDEVDLTSLEGDEMGMRYPLPPYVDQFDVYINHSGKQRRVLDLRYELIRARALHARPRLRAPAYTPDPLDYSLCFLLGTWFGNPSIESITGVAEQLEACGSWHLAIQALAYHPDDTARSHLIRGVLSRHAPAKADTPELRSRLELMKRLRVPEKWVLLAQAHRAKYERLPMLEAEHLVGAEQWNAAHKVLLEELLPEAVLADELQSISPLLEKLSEAARRHEVSGWESGGQALYHYLHVCDEIRGLVSSAEAARDRASVQSRLEALRPTVAAACRALGGLTTKSPRQCAARAEMGARLVQLALAAGEPPHHLASLLRALKLPPDCTATAQHKITTDLAEQASELCIESASSSPLSSHHRATVQS